MIISKSQLKTIIFIFLLFVLSRACIYFVGYLGHNLFSNYEKVPNYTIVSQSPGWEKVNLKLPDMIKDTNFPTIDELAKFDSGFYLNIAQSGYNKIKINEKHSAANWVFFPLYPFIVFLFHKILYFLNIREVAVILSNLFLFIALIFIYLICKQKDLNSFKAKDVLWLILIYPTSIYFSVPYTESLFLLLCSSTIYFTLRRSYFIAFILSGLSVITRVPGFLNLFFVLGTVYFEEMEQNNLLKLKVLLKYLLYFLLSLIPMSIFLIYMKLLTGDFLAPFHEQSINWFRKTTVPFINLLNFIKHPYFTAPGGWDIGILSFTVSILVLFVFITHFIVEFRNILNNKKELLFFIYGFLLIVIPFSSSEIWLTSVIRYLMVSLPLYVYIIKLSQRWPYFYKFYTMLFISVNVIITIGFFNHYYFVV